MVQKLSKSEMFSLILIIVLQFVAIAAANMLIPSYAIVIDYYHIDNSYIGVPDGIFVLVSAILSLIWGYYTDRIDRSRVIMIGAFLWSIGTTITAFDTIQDFGGFKLLIFSRGLTGAGMGCVLPVGYSILGDLIPPEERSGYFGTMAILSSVSNGAGQGMSSFLGPLNIFNMGWRFPFALISIISIIIIFLLFFVNIPQRGSHEEELELLQDLNIDYVYQLTKKDFISIMKKKTNMYIFIQGFLSIIPGTLITFFLTTMFSHSQLGLFKLLPDSIRLQVSTIMAGFVGIGYLIGNSVLAGLGDQLFKKDRRNRVRLSAISLFISVPLVIGFVFLAPKLDSKILPFLSAHPNPGIFETIIEIFKLYPNTIGYLILSFIASFFSAAPIANRGAVLVDVNLPEHRGTSTSLFNLSEQLGKGFTLLLSAIMLSIFHTFSDMIIFASLFWLPAAVLWLRASKTVKKDMDDKSIILKERSQLSFLDYIFELEIKLDEGIQLVHDARRLLIRNKKKEALDKFKKSIKLFNMIEKTAKNRDMPDLETKAHNLYIKALLLLSDYKNILQREKNMLQENMDQEEIRKIIDADLRSLYDKIKTWWEPSDIGKIETLFETAYYKVLEAKLNRNYSLFETIKHIDDALNILNRVKVMAQYRLVDEDAKKLNDDEKEFQKRVKD
ncbi:MAG: MFS transporter, partial [Promethearchaeota archaeon]